MQEPTVFETHSSYVLGLLFARDGRTLVSAGMDDLVERPQARRISDAVIRIACAGRRSGDDS